MALPIYAIPEETTWKQAYMNAMLEKDADRISAVVHTALIAIAEREHALLYAVSGSEERELMQDARYTLEAVLSSLPYRDPEAA